MDDFFRLIFVSKKAVVDVMAFSKAHTKHSKGATNDFDDLEQEGRNTIDRRTHQVAQDLSSFHLEENEERMVIDKSSLGDPKLEELKKVLVDWINDTLVDQRIIVQDIQEDLFDGQVLQKLLEKLGDVKLDVREVTQTAQGQKGKLRAVLSKVCEQLEIPRWDDSQWSVDAIHSKSLLAILHLLVALAIHYKAPIRLPEKVILKVIVVTMRDGKLIHRSINEEVTSTLEKMTGDRFERDPFDTLVDHAPEKLVIVKKSLVDFANRHLASVNLTVTDLDSQFADGVYLVLLMGLLEGYFVPLYTFNLTPETFEEKVHNINLAFELMQDAGLPKPKARAEDVVNCELKTTLRVIYTLFTKYKKA